MARRDRGGSFPLDVTNEKTIRLIREVTKFVQKIENEHESLKPRILEVNAHLIRDGFDAVRRRGIFDACFRPYMKKAWFFKCLPDELKRRYTRKSTVDFKKTMSRISAIELEVFSDAQLHDLYFNIDSLKTRIEKLLEARHVPIVNTSV